MPPTPPVAPGAAVWRSWSPARREAFLDEASEALRAAALLLPESRPHRTTQNKAVEALTRWFRRNGRDIYIGAEELVVYPEGEVFCPDLFAVIGVPDPGPTANRSAWVVADEGRGPDLILELLFRGDRRKDLIDNVARYAALGVREYFVFDMARRVLHVHRLAEGARRYEPIANVDGELPSAVLGLSLALDAAGLRFRAAGADLPETAELLDRAHRSLTEQVDRVQAEADRADRAEAAQRAAEASLQAEREARQALEARLAALLPGSSPQG